MNIDTTKSVDGIRARGWYTQGQTLGEGGWSEVYKFSGGWRHYACNMPGTLRIVARDDGTATKAFRALYFLTDDIKISERTVTYREVT